MRHKLLIIDDDISLAEMLALHFEDQDYYVDICNTITDAENKPFDNYSAILLDHHLTDGLGLNFLKALKESQVTTPIIMMTGKHDMDLAIEALRLGALDYIHKPLDMESLDRLINDHIQSQKATESENIISITSTNPKTLTPKIIGSHPAILETIKKIALASNNTSSVFIHGDAGTGKRLASKVIHHYFSEDSLATYIQASDDFIIPNQCSFLVIDQIEKLSPHMQSYIHSWILSKENSAPKIIATSCYTAQELKQTISAPLCQKLMDMQIHIPSLEERASDIQALAIHITSQLVYNLNSSVTGIHKDVFEILKEQTWAGNAAELQSVLSHALQITKTQIIDIDSIQTALKEVKAERSELPANNIVASSNANLKNMEEALIIETLMQNKGHKSNSASALGISRPALDRKISKYNIDVQKIKQQSL